MYLLTKIINYIRDASKNAIYRNELKIIYSVFHYILLLVKYVSLSVVKIIFAVY